MNRLVVISLLLALVVSCGALYLLRYGTAGGNNEDGEVSGSTTSVSGTQGKAGGKGPAYGKSPGRSRNVAGERAASGKESENSFARQGKGPSLRRPGEGGIKAGRQPSEPRKQGDSNSRLSQGSEGKTRGPLSGLGQGAILIEAVDEEGTPFSALTVVLSSERGEERGATDTEGFVSFGGLPEGRYVLRVEGQDQLEGESRGITLASGEERDITLRCGRHRYSVEGRCLDSDGNPLGGVKLEARDASRNSDVVDVWPLGEKRFQSETDGQGYYAFEGLPPGEIRISASWPVTGERKLQTINVPAAGSVDFKFAAPFSVVISGVCTDPERFPVQGVSVYVAGHRGSTTRTDQAGSYRLESRMPSYSGSLVVRAGKEGYLREQKVLRIEEKDYREYTVDFVLHPSDGNSAIEGVLVDTEGAGVPGETVLLTSSSARVRTHTRSSSGGRFSFTGLKAADDYTLSVFPNEKYQDLRERNIAVSAEETLSLELVLKFSKTGSVRGTLYDGEGRPLGGFSFRIRSARCWSQEVNVCTEADGSFFAEEVPSGTIIFDTTTSPRYSVRGLELKAGEEKDVRLIFGRGSCSIEGYVTAENGDPEGGARLFFSWSDKSGDLVSRVQHRAVTDNSGWYRVSGLAPGQYSIMIRHKSGDIERKKRNLNGHAEWDF